MLAPQLMLGLAVGQLVLAEMLWKLKQASQWWAFAAAFISLNGVFFALANWGTSDITRFSHYLTIDPGNVVNEPLWVAAAPLISALPYRLASVHGAVKPLDWRQCRCSSPSNSNKNTTAYILSTVIYHVVRRTEASM